MPRPVIVEMAFTGRSRSCRIGVIFAARRDRRAPKIRERRSWRQRTADKRRALAAANVLFEKVRMQASELDGETISRWRTTRPCTLPSTSVPICGRSFEAMPAPDSDTSDDPAGEVDEIRQDQAADGLRGTELGHGAGLPAGREYDDWRGDWAPQLVALSRGGRNRHREATRNSGNLPFEPAEVIDIGNDGMAGAAGHRRNQRHATWRNLWQGNSRNSIRRI